MARQISDSKIPGWPVWNIGGHFITKHRLQPLLHMSIPIQQSLFEDDFLIRTLGEIAYRPETAISELVANAWDAGATCVQVVIPDEIGGTISVSDNGVGLNQDLFLTRWMKLGYRFSQASLGSATSNSQRARQISTNFTSCVGDSLISVFFP